jgi:hypothetical protein
LVINSNKFRANVVGQHVRNLAQCGQEVWRSGSIDPLILKLGERRMCVFSFTLRPLTSWKDIFCSFYPAASVSERTVLYGVTIPECGIGKELEENGRALTKVLPKHLQTLSKTIKILIQRR